MVLFRYSKTVFFLIITTVGFINAPSFGAQKKASPIKRAQAQPKIVQPAARKIAQNNIDHLLAAQLDQELNGKRNTQNAQMNGTKINADAEYMHATQQVGASCSHHAIINAWAIQELLRENKQITSKSIAQKAAEKYHLIPKKPEFLELQDIITRLNNDILDVRSLYFLMYNTSDQAIIPAGVNEREPLTLDQRVAQYKKQANDHMLFICHVPGHWILIAAIKENNKTRIILLDSMNSSLEAGRKSLVEYVQDLLA